MGTRTQRLTVTLAFLAAVLSFAAVAVRLARDGSVDVTPLFGGLLMLALAVGGYVRLKRER